VKLHFHPVSTTSRPVMLFCAESNIAYEPVVVDLVKGEHHGEAFLKLNPAAQVPVLEDGDLILPESSAILKYLADKTGSAAYPKDLKARARVNSRMDWLNTTFIRELCYHLAYPQIFPHHVRTPEVAQTATIEWGRTQTERALKTLDEKFIGQNKYLCGDDITLADYFAAGIIVTGSLIRINYARFPNVDRWLKTMQALPSWKRVHEAVDGFAGMLKEKSFVTIS
jgi:glutathione S-transferase